MAKGRGLWQYSSLVQGQVKGYRFWTSFLTYTTEWQTNKTELCRKDWKKTLTAIYNRKGQGEVIGR